jgi:type IV pilus assembly protein PilY1
LSVAELYAGIVYFTSYQPSISDPCHPQGNGFVYSLNYCDSTPGYPNTPRFARVPDIPGIPPELAIVTREGQAAGMTMMGSSIKGKDGDSDFTIKGPGFGLELYYWRNSDSQRTNTTGVVNSGP